MSKTPSPHEIHIEVSSRHGQVSDGMRDYAIRKVTKLSRFHDRLSSVQVVLEDPNGEREIEILAHVDSGRLLVAREQAGSFRASIDQLVDKMERQLKKDKERLKDHKIHGGKGVEPPDAGRGDEDEPFDDVVRRDLG